MKADANICVHPCSSVVSLLMSRAHLLPFNIAASPVAGAVRCGSRVFLSGRSALRPDGSVAGLGDAAAQTHAALDQLEAALQAAGGSLRDITKLTTSLVDRAHRKPVYEAIGQRLRDVFPVSTGLLVAGLPLPELMVQIDAEAVVGSPVATPAHVRDEGLVRSGHRLAGRDGGRRRDRTVRARPDRFGAGRQLHGRTGTAARGCRGAGRPRAEQSGDAAA